MSDGVVIGEADVVLSASGVGRAFRGLQALSDYGVELQRGEILGVIGPNGAGKSTLFNVITGFLPPTSGQITFGGRQIAGRAPHRIAAIGIARKFKTGHRILSTFRERQRLTGETVPYGNEQ